MMLEEQINFHIKQYIILINFNQPPKWKIGTDPRNTLGTGPKYDYYLRKDVDVLSFI